MNNNPNSNTTANSAKLYKLKATATEGVTGLGITLKVMAGDRIDIFGKSYYFTNNTGGTGANNAIPVLDILAGLLGGPTGGTAAAAHGGVTALQLSGISNVTGGITTLLGDQTTDAAGAPTVPKAYINYIFFDEQFKVAGSGFSRVGSNSVVKTHTDLTNKTAPKNGYVYIYVSNESPVDVFFDNLQVIHTRGAILEETHYYPFGLTMAGISSKALNNAPVNRYKFNDGTELANKEFSDGSGLEWYETTFRNYDPQIGRFHQIDPLSIISNNQSPYAYVMNNPLLFNDPLGLDTTRGNTPKPNPDPGDVWIPGKGPDQIFDADQGWTPNPVLQEVVVGGDQSNNNESYYTGTPIVQASFFNGDISTSDAINVIVGFGGAVLNQVQANMINYKNNTLLPKARVNGFNSYYTRQIKNVNLGINKLGKVGKGLGYAGLLLQGANLGVKYATGEGITKKDVLDAGVSVLLTVVAISNPAVLIGVGIYGLLDSFGAFDGIKEAIGANDDVILKR